MKSSITCVLILCFLFTSAPAYALEERTFAPADHVNDLGFRVFSNALSRDEDNVIISPVNLYSALLMLYAESKGEQKNELSELLGFKGQKSDVVIAEYGMFLKLLSMAMAAEHREYDVFKLSNIMTNQAASKGRSTSSEYLEKKLSMTVHSPPEGGKENVEEMFEWGVEINAEPSSTQTKIQVGNLTLDSTLHFNVQWRLAFDHRETKKANVWATSGERSTALMMKMHHSMEKVECDYLFSQENELFQVIQLKLDKTAMVVFSPQKTKQGYVDLKKFNADVYAKALSTFSLETIDLRFPRFSVASQISQADLLSGNWEEELVHSSFFRVDEAGVNAPPSDPTVCWKQWQGEEIVPLKLRLDHPFIFIVRDPFTRAILFMGRVSRFEDTP